MLNLLRERERDMSNSGSSNNTKDSTNGGSSSPKIATFAVKAGLAQMLKGGVIMDVTNAEQVLNIMVFSIIKRIFKIGWYIELYCVG